MNNLCIDVKNLNKYFGEHHVVKDFSLQVAKGEIYVTEANQDKFAEILAWAVEEYQLDGIDFDDEWSKYGENPNFPTSVPDLSHCETS